MEVLVIRLIDELLDELSKNNKIVVSVTGPLLDSATVAFPTFIAGCLGGPVGAVLGAALGTGVLGVSKALGFGSYKPLMTVLQEDFSERERLDLYERMWDRLKAFVSIPINQSLLYRALNELSSTVQSNPEVLETIRNEINKTLKHLLI